MNRSLLKITIVFLLTVVVACENNQSNKPVSRTDSTPGTRIDSTPVTRIDSTPGTRTDSTQTKQDTNPVLVSFSNQTMLHFDSNSIRTFIKKYPSFNRFENDLNKFYSSRQYAYAWYDTTGMIEQADNLYNQIAHIDNEGISGKTAYKDSLNTLFDNTDMGPTAEKDLMLTSQYFNYAERVWGGISEAQTKKINWLIPRKKLDLPFLMDSLLRDSSSSLIKNGYSFRQYDSLKIYLKRYRDLAAKNNWTPIKTNAKSLKKGESSEAIKEIRNRLFALGDLPSNSGSDHFDNDLENAVKSYQARTGLKQDGVIRQPLIQHLNVPINNVIEQIVINMERCRWVPVNLNDNYLVVNIPDFKLYAFENNAPVFSMKVVVGKSVHKTVIFNGDLKYVVFSPYWTVPPGILKNEVLPAIKKDPHYLKKNNMEWYKNTVRQKPGPKNSLGLVKFLFPNEHNIYLHDSPAKSLFNEEVRAFSHGCIRVEQPKKLAAYLLRNDPGWTDARIDKAMHSGKEQYVTLKKAVPVFIAYLTAWVDRSGKLNLRKDIYKRDPSLSDMLVKD